LAQKPVAAVAIGQPSKKEKRAVHRTALFIYG
jgi:hypothetical protein